MAKHTIGFPADHPRDTAIDAAVTILRTAERPQLGPDQPYTAHIVDTEAHQANGEYVVVVRTAD